MTQTHLLQVGPRYHNLEFLGEGAYGVVAAATDSVTGNKVAIKKVVPFEHQGILTEIERGDI